MCGLFGAVGLRVGRERLDLVAHRGPDGSGWLEFASPAGPVVLGHRRLSIIDLSEGGAQPMSDPTGRYWLVFNGEIYNYRELRADLAAGGERFASESDSEVLLRAYMVRGEAMLDDLRGMFAFLIWDDRNKTLFAARDRFGIKPLYWFRSPGGFAFASEIKQLLGLPGVSGRMNVARVHDFLASGLSDHTRETMFAGIEQLRPGECVTWTPAREPTIRRWYAQPPDGRILTATEAAERFRALLDESVNLHLRADVPVGSCLSGGLDSSSIVCLMARRLQTAGADLHTVQACYPNKEVDEKPFMDEVVQATGAISHPVWPRAEDVLSSTARITWHQDEPFGSSSIFAQWCVFEEAKRAGVKVMLDGQGADEILAGYHPAFAYHHAGLLRAGRLAALRSSISERHRLHGASWGDQITRLVAALLPRNAVAALRGRRGSRAWLSGELIAREGNPDDALVTASQAAGLPEPRDVDSLCRALTFGANLQMLLHWEDRNSMAHGIEARVPFLDHPLVEFALGLGNQHKIVGGTTKTVLRGAMTGILPERVRTRQDKLGFATPEQAWFRGPMRAAVIEGVEVTLARFPDLLDPGATRSLVSDMMDGRRPLDFTLWRIVNIGMWGDTFRVGT